MSETDKGVLIYNEWFEAMENLSAKDYKSLLSAVYRYQILNVPPPEFKGKAQILASVIFPYIERRKKQAERGKRGVEVRLGKAYPNTALASSEALSKASSEALSEALSEASSQSIKENSIEENSTEKNNENKNSIDLNQDARISTDALAAEKGNLPIEKKAAVGSGFGKYGNVYLSTEEYLAIKSAIPDADRYIDTFSQKLYTKGYRYPDHAAAILEWWKRDSKLASRHDTPDEPPPPQGSFDTDEFFSAAVKRSLGDDATITD